MYKKFAALLLAAVMVFAMFGCKGATEPNPNSTVAPTQGNNDPAQTNTENNNATQNTEKVYTTYTQVYSAEVSTLNYLQSTATDVTVLGSLCVDGLVEFDRYGVMQPCLAESWDVSDDGTVYTFHLRQGVKWYTYEGEEYAEVKAGDFVAAAEYVLNAANASKVSNTLYHNIAGAKDYYDGTTADFSTVGIKAFDDYTVEYTLVAPLPYFIKMVSLNPWFPAQADFLAEQGDQFGTSNDTLLYCARSFHNALHNQPPRRYTQGPHSGAFRNRKAVCAPAASIHKIAAFRNTPARPIERKGQKNAALRSGLP